jgi:hypothetical protein
MQPAIDQELVFEEADGQLAAEVEHFFCQTDHDVRGWYLTTADQRDGPANPGLGVVSKYTALNKLACLQSSKSNKTEVMVTAHVTESALLLTPGLPVHPNGSECVA